MNNDLHFSSKTNEWYTPQDLYQKLDDEFHFTLDPCCTVESAKCEKYFTINEDGLSQDWDNNIIFVNPPYGRDIKNWVKKAHDEFYAMKKVTIVMLIPARTDTSYWHDYIFDKAEIRFMRGRVKFQKEDGTFGDAAPFPTAIIVYNRSNI